MFLQKGNRAIATHSAERKSLLLFRKAREIFEEQMVYETHHVERAPDSKGLERNAIVFELRPLWGHFAVKPILLGGQSKPRCFHSLVPKT